MIAAIALEPVIVTCDIRDPDPDRDPVRDPDRDPDRGDR
jgi:hypothetical protein